MEIISGGYTIRQMVAGTGGGVKGDMAVVSSDTAVKAADAPSANTVLGLFVESVDAAAMASIAVPHEDALIRSEFTGSSKTSLTDADIGKVFDLTDENTVNLDDTTGGICVCQGYDNTNGTIDFVITKASMFW